MKLLQQFRQQCRGEEIMMADMGAFHMGTGIVITLTGLILHFILRGFQADPSWLEGFVKAMPFMIIAFGLLHIYNTWCSRGDE